MGSIGSSMSPSARMTAASGIARQLATWPSCARSPSTSWGGTEHPGSACGRVASRPPGTMITCSLFWLADFMRRPCVEDYVGPDNPVRFLEAFVDGLDLEAAGFARVEPRATGRPGYAPADLLKLYIYGYLNRIRSSRRLEAEAGRNLEVIWLLRHLQPDFKTIADFRCDNRNAFRQVFRAFVLLCRELDLFGRELIAVDGTR